MAFSTTLMARLSLRPGTLIAWAALYCGKASTVEAPPLERKLVAILAADVVGYSQLMHEDEEGTLATLTAVVEERGQRDTHDHRDEGRPRLNQQTSGQD